MVEPRAYYFHLTLYSFNAKAVEAVIRNLHDAVQSVAMQCHYDRELDGFELSCPQQIGPVANDALHKVIGEYVKEEIEGAENAERKPNIERFADSLIPVDDFDQPAALEAPVTNSVNASQSADPSQPQVAQLGATVLHSVCDEGSKSTIKLFNLRDTGTDMLLRTLVDPGRKLQDAVYTGYTCRVAKWNPDDLFYAFNGRVGEPIVVEKGFGSSAPIACNLVKLRGAKEEDEQEDGEETTPVAEDSKMTHWNFKGEKPNVKQFLEGMGETELVDPETAPDVSEMPSDARKYNAAPEHQTRIYGRSRRPAAMEPDSDEDEDEDASEDTDEINDEDADEGEEESRSPSDEAETSQNPMLKMLRSYGPQPARSGEEELVAAAADEQMPSAPTPRADTTDTGNVSGASNHRTGPFDGSAPARALRNLESSFVKVDKNGLTGNAKLQAEWDHDVPAPSPRKPNKHGIARRPPAQLEDLSPQPTSDSSAAMSLSTGPNARRESLTPTPNSSFGGRLQPLEMLEQCFDTEPEHQPWSNRTQTSAVVTGSLVDVGTSCSRAGNGQMRPPPGFEMSFDKSYAPLSKSQSTVKPAGNNRVESHLTDLIGLDFVEPPSTTRGAKPYWKDQPVKPIIILQANNGKDQAAAHVSLARYDDDGIVERLQDHSNQKRPFRNTMRQKAARKKKNGKGKKTASAKPKSELPLPSPPPPPKPKQLQESSNTESGQDGNEADGPKDTNGPQGPLKDPRETQIERLLGQVEHLHGMPDVELQVSFGMLMVRSKDETLRVGNFNASKLQSRLQGQQDAGELLTDFFERLTASDMDAAYLFDLLPGEALEPRVEYEIGVRLLQGEERAIKFDQTKRDDVHVFAPEQTAVTLFMHYPIRVHDARSRVIKTEFASDVDPRQVTEFVSSIHTMDNVPSFKALVPRTAFSVNYVHVKRVFTKEIIPGVQLRVTETQDLHFAPISNSTNFNLLATSTNRATMVDTHRQWYECSMHLAPVGGVMGEVLQSLIDQMVAEMDGVGFCNRGPYWMTERETEEVEEVKFW